MPKSDTWFKPGQSGNPKGRPKRVTFEELVTRVLDEPMPGQKDITKREHIARDFVKMLLASDGKMLREFMERVWPKTTKHEIAGSDGQPLDFVALAKKAREEEAPEVAETLQ